jgi:hypothetical protein
MKVVAKPIEVVSYTDSKGDIRPIKIRIQNEEEGTTVIKVDKVLHKDKEKLAGNPMLIFRCQSIIDEVERQFELKYDLQSCRWMLFKI